MPQTPVNDDVVKAIKELLWAGELTQHGIANTAGVSQGTVSNIKRGELGRHVPWPNGDKGEYPTDGPTRRTRRTRRFYMDAEGMIPPASPVPIAPRSSERVPSSSDGDSLPIHTQERSTDERPFANDPDVRAHIERMGEQIGAKRTTEAATTGIPEEPEEIVESEAPTKLEVDPEDLMDWDEILEMCPHSPVVCSADLMARESDDIALKTAIQLVYKSLPKKEWDGEQARSLIESVRKKLCGTG